MSRLMYPMPLSREDREELFFNKWLPNNEEAWAEIENTALFLHTSGKRVSTRYLIERQRYEGRAPLQAVPFLDIYGTEHCYKINNSDTPTMARLLLKKFPFLNIETRGDK